MTWPSVTFGDVFEIQLGKMLDKKKNVGELRPYLANRNVRWGECDVSSLGEMRFTAEDRAKYGLRHGDLLVCEGGEVGRTAIWGEEIEDCYYQKAIHRLRPKSAVEPRFVLHYMSWAADRDIFARLTSATSIAHLTKAKLQKVPLPLPPLAEQKRIAGILDAADALRAKRRESLAQLDTLLQSTFLDMFGDPVNNPMEWEVVELASLIERGDKINYGVVQPGSDYPDGKPLIRVGDFVGGQLVVENVKLIDPAIEEKYPRSRLNGRELLISCVGSVGTVCKVPSEAAGFNIARAVARVPLLEAIDRSFMLHCLRSEAVQRHFLKETRTVSQPTLNIGLIKKSPVIQPPAKRQLRFAAIVESIEQQKASQRAHLAELDTLFGSLQSRAFRGDL